MQTIFIEGIAVVLPYREGERPGDPLGPLGAQILDYVLHRRVKAKLRWMLEKGDILKEHVQDKARELCALPLKPHAMIDDSDDADPVLSEAMEIARSVIIARMAAEGLPPPKGIDTHAKQLVDNIPQLVEQARKRIEARYRAAQELIGSEAI